MSTVEYKAKLMFFPGQKPIDVCGCRYCENEWHRTMDELDPDGWMSRIGGNFIVCKDCGCKRCPRASYHGHECTRSNDSGQAGSVYGDFKLDTAWMDNDEEATDVG